MKKRLLFILCLVLAVVNFAFGQAKTVTNSDLEKFRQKRLEAERDYRENYAKLGLLSPQELEAKLAADKREMEELSARLEASRLEREKTQLLQSQINLLNSQNNLIQSQTRSERGYFYNSQPYIYSPYLYLRIPKYRPNYNRRNQYWRNNDLPPIRPPKPIRPPRNFRGR
ncbi:MAG TPA: hypothetical protein VGC76_17880 [Pyrinomonadaceae bacterium]|jgi:hypothetical protein